MASELVPKDFATPSERLVRRTGFGLAVFTLALIAILLAIVGIVTAAAVTQMTDQSVDSNLHAASENMLIALAPTPTAVPSPSPSATPATTPEETGVAEPTTDTGSGIDEGGDGEGDGAAPRSSSPSMASVLPTPKPSERATPSPISTTSPTPTPARTPAPAAVTAGTDRPPEGSDTFFLVLDTSGNVVANPQNVAMSGLPDLSGAGAAASGTEDLRTIDSGGTQVRLLSEPMFALDGSISGVLQTGFVLTAHEAQKTLIVQTIILASLAGLVGAAIVTLFVTRRAMSPIRAAFAAERRFVASASHELKTPVSIVHASAEILEREDLVKPEGLYLVNDIVSESERMGLLVGDMLALASAQAGQIPVSLRVIDVRAIVDAAVERVQLVAQQKGVNVVVGRSAVASGQPEPLLVLADRERLLQLLTIFIDNAIDHSPAKGTVTVTARTTDEGARADPRVVLEVTDQGPGVPPNERERIFEPFARASGVRRTTGTTGLGLAIARILATRQRATLAVKDAPGGGAVFSVSLARLSPG